MRDTSAWVYPVAGASVIALATLYVLRRLGGKQTIRSNAVDPNRQSIVYPGEERIHACAWWPQARDPKKFLTTREGITTLWENFLHGASVVGGSQKCVGWRESTKEDYRWMTYGDMKQRVLNFGSGLASIGVQSGQETYIGLFGINCVRYDIAELALMSRSIVVVPLYETLGADAVTHIIQHTRLEVIIVDSVKRATQLIERHATTPVLKKIVIMEANKTELAELRSKTGELLIYRFQDLEDHGALQPDNGLLPPKPSDTVIICNTSGTTGTPKGVIITHEGSVATLESTMYFFEHVCGFHMDHNDVTISYLPMAHLFGQMIHASMYRVGGRIGYFSGDVRTLTKDMKDIKVTLFPVVPRLLSRVYDMVIGRVDKMNPLLRSFFHSAVKRKLAQMKEGNYSSNSLIDYIVFNKIRKSMGGAIRTIVTGSAPISPEVLNMCRVIFGCPIFEGYGQTETSAVGTLTVPGDIAGGNVGGPLPGCHVKLIDVPELEYFAAQDAGEILFRGPIVMKGYLNEPEKTAETIDADGWLHTGDIGRWLPNGSLKIIDRKKHIFKLAQGEYVAPEKIEGVYIGAPIVEQVYVDGNSTERYLVAIVFPTKAELMSLAEERGVTGKSFEELCADKMICSALLEGLQKHGKEAGLNSIEQIQALHVESTPFSIENGLLTPTQKNKRPQLRKYYGEIMDQLYANNKNKK